MARTFADTLDFMRECWRDETEDSLDLKSGTTGKPQLIIGKEEIQEISQRAEQVMESKEEEPEE